MLPGTLRIGLHISPYQVEIHVGVHSYKDGVSVWNVSFHAPPFTSGQLNKYVFLNQIKSGIFNTVCERKPPGRSPVITAYFPTVFSIQ